MKIKLFLDEDVHFGVLVDSLKTNQTDQTNAHNTPNIRNLRSRQASQAQADCFSAVSSEN